MPLKLPGLLALLCLALGLVCHSAATSRGDSRRDSKLLSPGNSPESAYLDDFEKELKSDLEEIEERPLFSDELKQQEKKDNEKRKKRHHWIKGDDRDRDTTSSLMPGWGDNEGGPMHRQGGRRPERAKEGGGLDMFGSDSQDEEEETESERPRRHGKDKESEIYNAPTDEGDDDTVQWLQQRQTNQSPKLHAFLQPQVKPESA
ncbi:hypothetical protein Emag_007224 [Eimeria magna]